MTEDEVTQAVERVRLELVGRKFMVSMISLIAVWVGIAMILTGAPNFIEDWFSPWSRYVIGGIAFLFGLSASLGGLDQMVRGDRRGNWFAEVIGLTGVVLFYLGMALAYAVLAWQQGLEIVGPGQPLPESITGRGYVPFVYVGLATMAVSPLFTMIRIGRPG